MARELHVVTGAFGYSGRQIAKRLLERGHRVRTLTGRPDRPNPFGEALEARAFAFDDPDQLRRNLEGTKILYNTYWIRFERGGLTFEQAVHNTLVLIEAAKAAGVERLVHTSITQPALDSPYPYFRGKAEIEEAIRASGLSYAILRPTVFFGEEDVLVNNMAWMLRRLPVFGLIGRGDYPLQPICVHDFARIALEMGERRDDVTADTVGPECFEMRDFLRAIARGIGSHNLLMPVPPSLALLVTDLIGRWVVHDIVLTRHEVGALLAGHLCSHDPPLGTTKLTAWIAEHRATLGRTWANELGRHFGGGLKA